MPIFLLVPQVKLPKLLDLARDAAWAHKALPGLVAGKWVKESFRGRWFAGPFSQSRRMHKKQLLRLRIRLIVASNTGRWTVDTSG